MSDRPLDEIAGIGDEDVRDSVRWEEAAGEDPREEEHVAIEMMEVVDVRFIADERHAATPDRRIRWRVGEARGGKAIVVRPQTLLLEAGAWLADARVAQLTASL